MFCQFEFSFDAWCLLETGENSSDEISWHLVCYFFAIIRLESDRGLHVVSKVVISFVQVE